MAKTPKRKAPPTRGEVSASLGAPAFLRHVKLKPSSYQPSKAGLGADVNVEDTPEDLWDAVMRPVVVKESDDA